MGLRDSTEASQTGDCALANGLALVLGYQRLKVRAECVVRVHRIECK